MFRDFPRSIVSRIKKQNNSPKDCSSLTFISKLRKGMFFLARTCLKGNPDKKKRKEISKENSYLFFSRASVLKRNPREEEKKEDNSSLLSYLAQEGGEKGDK